MVNSSQQKMNNHHTSSSDTKSYNESQPQGGQTATTLSGNNLRKYSNADSVEGATNNNGSGMV